MMHKILIIEDIGSQIENLKQYLIDNGICKDDISAPQCYNHPRNTKNKKRYTADEQYIRAKRILSDNWERHDIFLIDVFLLDVPPQNDENPLVSQRIFEDFLSENNDFKKAIIKGEKLVIFITSYGNVPSSFGDGIREINRAYWHDENKPDLKTSPGDRTARADCKNPWCREIKNSITSKKCNPNDCLKNLIMTFIEDGKGPDYQ